MKGFIGTAIAILSFAVIVIIIAGNLINTSDDYIKEVDQKIKVHTCKKEETTTNDYTTVNNDNIDITVQAESKMKWVGEILTAEKGVNYGPTGKETYYNLPMDDVIHTMRNLGFSEIDYPYWIRPDGVKMLGDYVMVAANWDYFPLGTVVECSLGTALVCDTGGFIWMDEGDYWLDIAVVW